MNTIGHNRKKKIAWLVLFCLLALTEIVKYFPSFIEQAYAQGIYPPIGKLVRFLFGWIPFSVGDVFVLMLIFWMLKLIFHAVVLMQKKQWKRVHTKQAAKRILFFVLSAYVLFHALWGFNYYRLGTAYLLQLPANEYSTADIDTLLHTLNNKLDIICKDSIVIEQQKTPSRKALQTQSLEAYKTASLQYNFLQMSDGSLKPNLIGSLQSYTGYGGYIFPYTGEAQVNFYAPAFTLPFTVCHEMAHQQGFGAESEANMIGFLACRESNNKTFVYSAYAEMHSYAINEMWSRDSVYAKALYKKAPLLLQKDRKALYAWVQQHKNPAQPIINYIYKNFLLSTNQPDGLQSYNRVVAWLIAYGKKNGWEKI